MMRKITHSIPFIAMLFLFMGANVQAGNPKLKWRKQYKLNTAEEIAKVKPGDQVIMHCKKCDADSMATIESKEHAEAMAKEGATFDCPSCKNVAKVTYMGPPSKKHRVVKFVDEHDEECMTMSVAQEEESSEE
jgi:hypothetical protein